MYKNFYSKKERKNVGIKREIFDKICYYSIEQLNDFIEYDIHEYILDKVHKNSESEAFIRIPKELLLKFPISTEEDRLGFLFHSMLYTYGASNNLLKYKATKFKKQYNIEPLITKELVKYYCNKDYWQITLSFDKEKGFILSFNKDKYLHMEKEKTEMEKQIKEIEKEISKYTEKDKEYFELKKKLYKLKHNSEEDEELPF